MDLGSALMALFIGLVVKAAVLGVGAWLLLKLYRAQSGGPPAGGRLWLLLPETDLPEVRILYLSLILFYISELTCGIEVYVLFHSNPVLSGTHSLTSGAGMGLFALGLVRLFDKRLIRYGGSACIGNRFCRGCTIAAPEGCRFRVVLMLVATFVGLTAIYPWFAPTETLWADPKPYVLPFDSWNTWYDQVVVPWLTANVDGYEPSGKAYCLPASMLVIELRLLPAVALVLAAAGVVSIRRGRELLGVELTAVAAGILCYVYFELVLYISTKDVILGSLGHEVAELWFLLFVAALLRECFRPGSTGSPRVSEREVEDG